jgi:hypothetical protein
MAATYEAIQTTTLGSSQATISLSSIPSTYTDLRLVLFAVAGGSGGAYRIAPCITFNSDNSGSTNCSNTKISGDGSSAYSTRTSNDNKIGQADYFTQETSYPILATFDVMNYASTSVYKTVLASYSIENATAPAASRVVGLWRSTSAISTITINNYAWGNNFGANTVATLYGIKAQ